MDIQRELREMIHRDVCFEHHLYSNYKRRVLRVTLMPRNKRGLNWCNKNIDMLMRELGHMVASSNINIEIHSNVKD